MKTSNIPVNNSISRGLIWLSSHQNKNGSFGSLSPITTTAYAIKAFSNYAFLTNEKPLNENYEYNPEINAALKYIFSNIKISPSGIYFEEDGNTSKPTGAVLDALALLNYNDCPITFPSPLGNLTFEQIINGIINYLANTQNTDGGWGDNTSYDNASNTVSTSFVTNGLLSVQLMQCTTTNLNNATTKRLALTNSLIPDSVYLNLENWVNFIQNENGGAGNYSPNEGVNIANTSVLIQQFYLLRYNCNNKNLLSAICYIGDHWYSQVSYFKPGWHYNENIDYNAAYQTMKGLSLYCVPYLIYNCKSKIIWYCDIVNVLLSSQKNDGSWPPSKIIYEQSDPVIATIYSLITLEIYAGSIYSC